MGVQDPHGGVAPGGLGRPSVIRTRASPSPRTSALDFILAARGRHRPRTSQLPKIIASRASVCAGYRHPRRALGECRDAGGHRRRRLGARPACWRAAGCRPRGVHLGHLPALHTHRPGLCIPRRWREASSYGLWWRLWRAWALRPRAAAFLLAAVGGLLFTPRERHASVCWG